MMKDNKAEEVLRSIEKASVTRFLPIVGPKKGKLLASLVRECNPKLILEIGTLVGYSAILMAQNLRGKEGNIITLEISKRIAAVAERNIKLVGFEKKIKIIVGSALKLIPKLEGKFDLVFVDAAKEEYFAYLKLLEKKNLKKGSIIVADNAKIFADAMHDYLEYVRKSGKYKSEFHDFEHDGMEVSVRL